MRVCFDTYDAIESEIENEEDLEYDVLVCRPSQILDGREDLQREQRLRRFSRELLFRDPERCRLISLW